MAIPSAVVRTFWNHDNIQRFFQGQPKMYGKNLGSISGLRSYCDTGGRL